MGRTPGTRAEAFALKAYTGEMSPEYRPLNLDSAVSVLVTPSASSETLHWGRNYLYSAELETTTRKIEVVVKQFRNQGPKARMDRRFKGSKAWRSWRGAWAMKQAGIPTPEPLMLIESRDPEGPSFYISERLAGAIEVRYFFRALEAGTERELFPELDADRLIERLGAAIRRLHDAGIWHRDLSIGNLLLCGEDGPVESPEIYFIDLNRSRHRHRLSTLNRTRDLCRLRIFQPQHQERFLCAYWGDGSKWMWRKRLLYKILLKGFLAKTWIKKAVRKPFRGVRDRVKPRHPHVHIPRASKEASARDRSVWDGLSDQPHQHATRLQRLAVRVADAPLHARELVAGLGALPKIRRRYRELQTELYREPIVWAGMGIALRPWPKAPEALLKALEDLGTRRVLLRLHPWQQEHRDEEQLATELHRRGFDLTFVLAQNRELVCSPERWRAAVTELAERFGKLGKRFQVGQAINRSKWGIWNHREYLELVAIAAEVLRRESENELLGPAVIDYEFLRTAGVLNISHPGVYFDALASLLYVDRRGAPENKQLGFDTVDKTLQLKAIADTSANCGNRSWITEMNWPLWEGPHSPAGRKVSVDEERQASYLVRYYLLTLGTGVVERVYWWQLIARGYGLCFDAGENGLRQRRSFQAFATLHRCLEGATFLGPVEASPPICLYRFRDLEGSEIVVGWSSDDSVQEIQLPRLPIRTLGRDGQELPVSGSSLEVDGSPRYTWLSPE